MLTMNGCGPRTVNVSRCALSCRGWSTHAPVLEIRIRCVDCGEEKAGEFYQVPDELWAASGLAPDGGELCLSCFEQRIGRPLVIEDFTLWPTMGAWRRYLAACENKGVLANMAITTGR